MLDVIPGLSRRGFLRIGALSGLGLSLPVLLREEGARQRPPWRESTRRRVQPAGFSSRNRAGERPDA